MHSDILATFFVRRIEMEMEWLDATVSTIKTVIVRRDNIGNNNNF